MREEIICAKFCCYHLMVISIFSQQSRHLHRYARSAISVIDSESKYEATEK